MFQSPKLVPLRRRAAAKILGTVRRNRDKESARPEDFPDFLQHLSQLSYMFQHMR
ncbi:MAG: hypothetical protein Kow0089_16920 [Desulfobulbaceae bacterium]